MPIDYLDHLPNLFIADSVNWYLEAFKDKLGPILGNDRRAKETPGF